ncbi:MAG: glycosyltransferase family 2 protein [Actinobacteria bacterium]|nr:glycosyltransferase family 2 protein [Actinomycetota bacterium]
MYERHGTDGAGERWAVVVAIPAHDEQLLLGRCLAAVTAAADRIRSIADVHIVVAADSCADATERVASASLASRHASIVRLNARNVGAARAAAITAGSAVVGSATDRLWLALTDADSRVPDDWLQAHLRAAATGYHAVVGAVAVDDWSARRLRLDADLCRYRQVQRRGGERPVHGANLGVSAAALQTVGGLPAQARSEDAALVARLEAAGMRVLWDPRLIVHTSARRSRRTPGGFSSLLDDLERRPPPLDPRCA